MKDVPRKKKHANSTYMKKVLNFYKCEDIKHIYVMWILFIKCKEQLPDENKKVSNKWALIESASLWKEHAQYNHLFTDFIFLEQEREKF